MSFDWNSIHDCVLADLGEHRSNGWVEALTLALETIKEEAQQYPGAELPDLVQIKQKWGSLRIYTQGGSSFVWDEIQAHVDQIERTCECCPNTADVQSIQGYATTLCAWCYNRELKRRNIDVNERVDFDIAEMFPDLVRPELARLQPATGAGWFNMIAHHLRQMEHAIEDAGLTLNTVQISDIKTRKDGRLSLGFHRTHECVDHIVAVLERSSSFTCAKCGHRGDIVRARDKSDLLCGCCYVRAVAWNPFEEGEN